MVEEMAKRLVVLARGNPNSSAQNVDASPTPTGVSQVGGVVRAPAKITHVSPRYPDAAYNARQGGVVILATIVDINGFVSQMTVLNSPSPELAAAAEDAVRQWRFTPTLLNGTPVEIRYNVTVSFIAR
jgi:protein TonB